MIKAMLLLLAALAAAHASVVPVLAPVAPVLAPVAPIAYDYGTTILDKDSFQQNSVTGYAGLGYGYSVLPGYRSFGPYGKLGGLYDGYYGGLGYGGYFPGGYVLGKR